MQLLPVSLRYDSPKYSQERKSWHGSCKLSGFEGYHIIKVTPTGAAPQWEPSPVFGYRSDRSDRWTSGSIHSQGRYLLYGAEASVWPELVEQEIISHQTPWETKKIWAKHWTIIGIRCFLASYNEWCRNQAQTHLSGNKVSEVTGCYASIVRIRCTCISNWSAAKISNPRFFQQLTLTILHSFGILYLGNFTKNT